MAFNYFQNVENKIYFLIIVRSCLKTFWESQKEPIALTAFGTSAINASTEEKIVVISY